jgi:hypothetical protein
MNTILKFIALAFVASTVCGSRCLADDEQFKKTGREVYDKHSDSVLFVTFTVKINMQLSGQGHQAHEQSLESLGTVIREDGLILIPNSSIDIAGQIRAQLQQSAPPDLKFDITTTAKNIKVILPDGSEVKADLVLQDADLDLAFIMPEPPGDGEEPVSWKPVTLAKDAPRQRVLDDIFILGRLDRNVNRMANIRVGRIESAIRRPRLIYRTNVPALGVPSFNTDGEMTGVFVRQTTGPGAGQFIIRPPKDVIKIVEQINEKAEDNGEGEAEEEGEVEESKE